MKYPYEINYEKDGSSVYWAVKSKVLDTVVAQGDTIQEALELFEEFEEDWLVTAEKHGFAIPVLIPVEDPTYSGKFMVRVSKLTHEKAAKTAKFLGISLNQYINDVIVDSNAVINTVIDLFSKGNIPVAKAQTQDGTSNEYTNIVQLTRPLIQSELAATALPTSANESC